MSLNIQHSSLSAAILILGHGSPVKEANETLLRVAAAVKTRTGYDIVQPAFLQFEQPNFAEAVAILAEQGIKQILVHPYFLYMGAHMKKDLPFEIKRVKKKYPDIEIILAPHLGFHEKLVEVSLEKIEEAMRQRAEGKWQKNFTLRPLPSALCSTQHPIEAESFRIIGKHLDESRFSPLELPIIKRLIHTTADFEYADLIRFSNNAIEIGIKAISIGANIIVDVKMIEAGINKERLDRFGGSVKCFISDEDVIRQAKGNNITRSAAAIRKAAGFMDGNIIAIGNAPTALMELVSMIKNGKVTPSLVIGVPVGFVDAEQSKEDLMKLDVPYISIKGKKGGSTIAVAIVNALLMMAEEKQL